MHPWHPMPIDLLKTLLKNVNNNVGEFIARTKSDGLVPGLRGGTINSLFVGMAFSLKTDVVAFSRRRHHWSRGKGKAQYDVYAEDKVECKKLKKQELRLFGTNDAKDGQDDALDVRECTLLDLRKCQSYYLFMVTSSEALLTERSRAVMLAKLMEQKSQARDERILEGKKRK
ncbi:hypothetical protein Tco_0843638 [Tanacetum coccineum]|uniref:Uncharacterized protein n=1 Tax=Tanacetum coccineum TaxID=301880 RepID=A0ABQ5B3I2_9ASTR